jgi:hypothetical protein
LVRKQESGQLTRIASKQQSGYVVVLSATVTDEFDVIYIVEIINSSQIAK